jgi:5-methylcytosine-specific restriction endonuclease McrA
MTENQVKWYKENKDTPEYLLKNRAKCLKYRNRHPLKKMMQYANANKRGYEDKITAFDLWKIVRKQKLLCPLSGRRLTPSSISIDHILPGSKGGKNVVANIRLTDKDANIAKNKLTDAEFISLCREVVKNNP